MADDARDERPAVILGPASPEDGAAAVALMLGLPGGLTEIFPRRAVAERVARAMFESDRTVFGRRFALVARVGGRVAGIVVRIPEDAWRGVRLSTGSTMMRAAGLRAPAVVWRGSRQEQLMPPVRAGFVYVVVLAVDPDHRRRGIATRLLREVIAEAEGAGRRGVALDVVADDRAAIALYETSGFEVVERRTIPPGRRLTHLSSLRMEFPAGAVAPRGDD